MDKNQINEILKIINSLDYGKITIIKQAGSINLIKKEESIKII